jgi:Domain of unknown function (DUF4386)
MTTTLRPPAATRAPMSSLRRTALAAGVFYLLSFVSVPTLALYAPVREANYIAGSGSGTGVIVGVVLEIIVALAGIGTAVALYPVLRRQNHSMALGFVGSRVLEAATIFSGTVILMTMVTLRQDGAGADALATGKALVAMHNWTFLVGQGFIPAVNGVLLGILLYRSRLVPRMLPLLGFVGAFLLTISAVATLFGLWAQVSTVSGLMTLPIGVWEFSLGVYLIVKGFKPTPLTAAMNVAGPPSADRPAVAV